MAVKDFKAIKSLLDTQYACFNAQEHLNTYPDPLAVVYHYRDFVAIDELALICALYAYGNAHLIVKNLWQMPFSLLLDYKALESSSLDIFPYYRFQSREDTRECFFALARLIQEGGLKHKFLESYSKAHDILDGIYAIEYYFQTFMLKRKYHTRGLEFLFGNPKATQSPLKRYNMFLRWMVRQDNLDLGLWHEIPTSHLLLPLDTHTFRIAHKLGICKIKSYNLKAVVEITNNLKQFDKNDPIKYDFALYRIGQLKLDSKLFE